MILADFNPAILFLLLWGLLSWFTKKKKKEARKNLTEDSGVKIEKEDIFTRLQKLQDHLAGDKIKSMSRRDCLWCVHHQCNTV